MKVRKFSVRVPPISRVKYVFKQNDSSVVSSDPVGIVMKPYMYKWSFTTKIQESLKGSDIIKYGIHWIFVSLSLKSSLLSKKFCLKFSTR